MSIKQQDFLISYKNAKDIPEEWDIFCKENFYMKREILDFLEHVNNCGQKYYIAYNEQKHIEACFIMFPFKYEFSKKLKLNVNLIFLPVSAADPGIVAIPNSTILPKCLKMIKGIKLILSTSEDFKLLNGIKYKVSPNCILNIKWNTFDDYLNSLRSKYRKRINIMLNKRETLSKRLLENNMEFNQEMYNLYLQIMNNVGYVLETLSIDFFRNNFSKTIVFELEGEAKAFVQFIEVKDKIIAEFCGFDYKDRDKYQLYDNVNLALIEYAINNGFKKIDIGQSAEGTKLKFGAYLEPKYSWIFFNGNKICNTILKSILLHSHKPRKSYKYNVFKRCNIGGT